MKAVSRALAPLQQGGLPLYAKVEEVLRKLILEQEYAGGGLLPDELTLADRLGVSRGTVRAAVLRLVAEGALERKAGVGTRVVRRSTESAITAWRSFSREMTRRGITVQLFRMQLQDVSATPLVATALRIPVDTPVQRLDRVRGWDEEPVLHSRSWFHPRIRFAPDEGFSRPLYDVVAEVSGLTAECATEAFSARAASCALARDLRIPEASPVLVREHTVSDSVGRPIEFAEVHYVSERFILTLDLRRQSS